MKSAIFNYELKYWLTSPLTYLFAIAFFALALVMMLGTGGYFDGAPAESANVRLLNSPYEINFIFQYFGKFLLFLIPVIVGTCLYRDYKSRSFHITYSFPIPKADYLFGKLLSGLSIILIISLFIGVALMLGEWMLGTENAKIGAFNIWAYLCSYTFFTIPNLLFFSVLVFIVVGMSRNIYAGFIAVLLLFLFQIIVENVFTNNQFLMALLDPFGQNAISWETKLWTRAEKNTQFIPVMGIVLYNRLLWAGITGTAFYLFYKKFELLHESPFNNWFSFFPKKNKKNITTKINNKVKRISTAVIDTSFPTQLRAMFEIALIDFKYMAKNWMFVLFALFGLLALVFTLLKVTNTGQFNLLPLTRIIVSTPLFFYSLIVILATFLYGGMLVHRAKNSRMNQLIDATTFANWSLVGSKIVALILLQITLLCLLLLGGIAIQIYNGYFHFELGQYLFQLFVITLPMLAIWAIYSIFVHTLSRNLFIGLFVLILTWLGIDGFEQLGLHTQLLKFNTYPTLNYNDFNGYGQQLSGHFLLKGYWLSVVNILGIIAYLFWERGITTSWKERFSIAKNRMSRIVWIPLLMLIGAFLLFGFKIYQEELKTASALGFDKPKGKIMSNFKSKFGKYAHTPQPQIDFINLELAIFPKQNNFKAKAIYTLKNNTSAPIDTLLIKTGFDEITETFIQKKYTLLETDSIMQYAAYQLQESLLPNETMSIHFDIKNKSNTLLMRNSEVIKNGTYLKQDILPRLGYFYEETKKEPSDTTARTDNYVHSNYLNIETKISTSEAQIAIAPGDLIAEKGGENGRNYYHYKTPKKVKFNFSFHSANYKKWGEVYKDIDIAVFHHPNHTNNIEKMVSGLKAAIDYNLKYFNAYPFKNIRVVEYPHTAEGYSATLMANNIPTSEIQFIINTEAMKDKIDMPFYVMAHELTHQWFGNDVMPADALGAKMLTESITEYISLQIYKQAFGQQALNNFLQLQHKRYLRGRAKEAKKEHALYRVKSEQQYIAYGKGATVFHTLSHYLGEEKLNGVLKAYLMQYKNRTDTYPTSLDFIAMLQEATDESFHYLIDDFFKTKTFYDNSIDEVKYTTGENGQQQLIIAFTINKYQNDELLADGTFQEDIEIGFFNENKEVVHIEKVKVGNKANRVTLELGDKIQSVVLDPNYLYIDKNRKNNQYKM